ncbi:MAG: hypothetical protein M3Q07_08900, partial [Pseudobdellovibrionaceae bacterium]|nr:hypothetical protein [Pseudobdellovibrionaceae bacterium]
MNKTAFALTSTTALILVMACQPKTKTKTEYVTVEVPKKEKVYEFTRESSGDPVEVQVYDPNCNDQRGLGLRSALIAEALIGVEMVRTSTTIEENIWENAKEKSITRQTYEMDYISQGRPVALCRDASTIPVNTQEGAAISMKSDADTAHALYQAVKNKGSLTLPTLEPIYLNAAIKVKMIDRSVNADDVAREDTEYQTDNAVFMGGTHPTLISYPQSKQSQKLKLLGGEPLWTVKGVFQHEFGHFIFSTMMNEGGASFPSYH